MNPEPASLRAFSVSHVVGRSGFRLTSRAEVGRAAGEDDALDRCFAAGAGFTFAVVDAVEALEGAGVAVGVHVVAERAAAVSDRAAEDLLDGASQVRHLLAREVAGEGEGVDLRNVERFIYIDVAEAGEESLVEQGGFDRTFRARELVGELPGADEEGLGAEVFFGVGGTGEAPDAAEAARVAEAQLFVEKL